MRPLVFALTMTLVCAAPVAAQDKPADPAPEGEAAPEGPSGEEKAAKKLEEQTQAETEQAGEQANQAAAALEHKRMAAENAKGALDAAQAKLKKAEEALAKAQAAKEAAEAKAAGLKEAAEAEGAGEADKLQYKEATDAAAASVAPVESAQATVDQAKGAVSKAETAAEEAKDAYEEAQSEAEAKAEAKAVAEKKEKAARAAKEAMERAKNMPRNAAMPIDVLELRIKPLTQEDLKAEADAWMEVLKAKATGISYATIALKDASEEDKAILEDALNTLRSERTSTIDRVNVVLDAYEKKGGDSKEYDAYLAAITGIEIAPDDLGSTWKAVVGWLKDGQGGIRWGKNLLFFLLTLLAFKIGSSVAGKVVQTGLRAARVKTSGLLQDFFVNTTRKVVMFVGVVVALSMLEVDIAPFLAAMGGVAFVVGFALQGTLSNFAAGIMILTYRPYDIGDFVEVAGVTGVVHAMSLVSTSLTTPDNQIVIIPNGSIWGGIITNATGLKERRIDLTIGIGYDDDIAKAETVLTELVAGHEKILKTPAPVIRLADLGDSSVNFVVRPWVKTSDYWDVRWDLTRQIKHRFDQEEGLGFPYPTQDINVHQVPAASNA